MSAKPTIVEPPHLASDLKELKLPTVAEHWERLAREAGRRRQSHAEYLAELTHQEVCDRRERRVQRRTSEARFPRLKTLDGFDFSVQPQLDRDEILELARCDFVDEHANVVLMGEVGTGKTHLAIALGMACCQQGRRVRFTTAAELTNLLVESRSADRLSRRLEQMARFDVVVLDELGYVPFDKLGADLLFSFITKIYERRSLIVTTNLPFARWNEVFLDATAAAAVIDRIVHHATILKTEGKSYRLRDAERSTKSRKAKARA
jgi:DNA replication protein DnaC